MVDLVLELRKLKLQKTRGMKGHKNQINVSVNTFIPKPHTPFQWASQLTVEESQKKIHWLKEKLNYSDVQFKWQHPRVGLLEGLWARGDRRLARLLVAAWQNGCRLDGWSDHFDASKWEKSLEETGIDIAFYTIRARDLSEPLPWDHIQTRVTRPFLISEWEKALKQESTPDCRSGDCQSCGVCDFQTIEPRVFEASESQGPETRVNSPVPTLADVVRYRISYAKTGPARVFGHLELANIMFRAFRRAKIPVEFSAGFHPKPKISFDDPLPVGMESLHETCVVSARPVFSTWAMMDRLNQALPEGLAVTRWELSPSKKEVAACSSIRYQIQLKTGEFDKSRLEAFLASDAFVITRVNRKGIMSLVNYKEHVEHLELDGGNRLILTIRSGQQQTLRPSELLAAVFELSDEAIKTARIVKLAPA
jgi:radical SAM-linked protein